MNVLLGFSERTSVFVLVCSSDFVDLDAGADLVLMVKLSD